MEPQKTNSRNFRPGISLEQLRYCYLKDNYHDFEWNADLQMNSVSRKMDHQLELLHKRTYAFVTATNPIGRILSQEENLKRYRKLEHDLSGYEIHQGEVKGHDHNSPASAGFFILQISMEQAMELTIKYGQASFLYGKKGVPATLVFRPLEPFVREVAFIDRIKKRDGYSPGSSNKKYDLFSDPVIKETSPDGDDWKEINTCRK